MKSAARSSRNSSDSSRNAVWTNPAGPASREWLFATFPTTAALSFTRRSASAASGGWRKA